METTTTSSSSSGDDGKGRWKYFCSLFMALVCMTVALHSINMRKGSDREGEQRGEATAKESNHTPTATPVMHRNFELLFPPSVTDLQLLFFQLLLPPLLLLPLLLRLFLLLPSLLPLLFLSAFIFFAAAAFYAFSMSAAYFCAPAALVLYQLQLHPLSATPFPRRAALACTFQGIVRLVRRVSLAVSQQFINMQCVCLAILHTYDIPPSPPPSLSTPFVPALRCNPALLISNILRSFCAASLLVLCSARACSQHHPLLCLRALALFMFFSVVFLFL